MSRWAALLIGVAVGLMGPVEVRPLAMILVIVACLPPERAR